MPLFLDSQTPDDAELIGSRIGRLAPDNFQNQNSVNPDDDDSTEETNDFDDEPVDEDGDPTGEHDHHQDDNYALGGHVTRSGS